jgi:ABC-2 type transport system permease protein
MTATTADRALPRWGGLSVTFLGLELRRLLRNRRTVIFTMVLPPVFFLLFGTNPAAKTDAAGHGNVTAYVMVSLAVYGAMLANTSGGAAVSLERAAGWSRQLRLTPLRPAAYVAVKLLVAMVLGLLSVVITYAIGAAGGSHMPWYVWLETGVLAWVCALVFAAFGLFMGYLLPGESVMQILGPVLALLAFAGGLFIPLDQMSHTFATIARFTPAFGVGEIARYPLTGDGSIAAAVLNVVVWTVVFAAGAAWRFRRDTQRV